MDKLIIASPCQDNMTAWVDALSENYSVNFLNKIELILLENRHFKKGLLILDVSLLNEKDQLAKACGFFDKVLVVGEDLQPDEQIQFIYEGAWGYSERLINDQLIVRSVEGVMNNEIWLERQVIPQMLQGLMALQQSGNAPQNFNNKSCATFSVLTQREVEVIELVYNGEDNSAISETLNITLRTVKAHLGAIFRKLDVQNRFQLVVFLKDFKMDQLANGEDVFRGNQDN